MPGVMGDEDGSDARWAPNAGYIGDYTAQSFSPLNCQIFHPGATIQPNLLERAVVYKRRFRFSVTLGEGKR